MNNEATRTFIRHALATIAYRIRKPISDVPDAFPNFRIGESSRSPVEILAHLGDLMEWSLSMVNGTNVWKTETPNEEWSKEVERFYRTLRQFDNYLASDEPLHAPLERLFQGPIADSLTHIGQLGMLRRLVGTPIKGENFFIANVAIGNVGKEQGVPVREF